MTEVNSSLINTCRVDGFLSDHAVILLEINLKKPPKIRKSVRFRRDKNIDISELEMLIEENLNGIGDITDLTELVNKFNKACEDAYDKVSPHVCKTVLVRAPTPWSYDEIKHDKATRRKLEWKWRQTGLQVDCEIYRDFRNI